MSELRPRGIPVTLNGVERHFLFTLSAIDAAQDKTGKSMREIMEDLADEETAMHTLRDLLVILSEDEVEREKYRGSEPGLRPITEKEAGYLIGVDNIWELVAAVMAAYGYSIPEPEEEDPNRESGQTNS